jgi:hypothetical protein
MLITAPLETAAPTASPTKLMSRPFGVSADLFGGARIGFDAFAL